MGPDSAEVPGILYKNANGEYKELQRGDIPEFTTSGSYCMHPFYMRLYDRCGKNSKRIAEFTLDWEETVKCGQNVYRITSYSVFYRFMVAEFFKQRGYELRQPVPQPKHARCRSRKRFIKLLMGTGMQRRQANWDTEFTQAANAVLRKHGKVFTYQTAWINMHISHMELEFPDRETGTPAN